ncbi:MAG: hypothetical protein HC896_12070 [Bacteroidales bacterium]|nr:hypothetical protein [Bacteroidales bacterium]
MELEEINNHANKEKLPYILMGPGRWGSRDQWLGIPVRWQQISNARAIVEYGLNNRPIEPSQGTHFFHNLTSFGVGYLTVDPAAEEHVFNASKLDNEKIVIDNEGFRLVKTNRPLSLYLNGQTNIGVIYYD